MAVYGGFSTRNQETKYNKLTESLIGDLQYFISSSYKGESIEPEWSTKCKNTLICMAKLEERKHYPPKFTSSCVELIETLEAPLKFRPNIRNYTELTKQETPKFTLSKTIERSLSPLSSPLKLENRQGSTELPPIHTKDIQLSGWLTRSKSRSKSPDIARSSSITSDSAKILKLSHIKR
ncbi:unnamed protein product [Blepharisma stoltei]|uniref:Uncharacterized protein n=1 Tax=Blepharisma stoltei TaxID=1481888 RepID=A0AAU9K199_9CILI|nr:unnamed protein product [Blepharisma stoltei]